MNLDVKQMVLALHTLAEEKNLPEEVVQDAVEQALAAAWRRDYGVRDQNVRASINLNTGEVDVYEITEVVDEVEDEVNQITLAEAKERKKDAKVGDILETHHKAETFGRVAAQTAKQVILQRLREAEREIVMAEFENKIGQIVNAVVTRVEPKVIRLELGRAQGIMPQSEQIQGERYYPGQRLKAYLKDVEKGFKGPQLVLSRGSIEFIKLLFAAEVPEMENGSVEIKNVAREAGVRTKLAVASNVPNIDPVGTFVGGHGTRVQSVNSEIGDQEKIDIIVWSGEIKEYITNALSPTEVLSVTLNDSDKRARVVVAHEQLSVAIGRAGQNVRLAGKLTGYEIDIIDENEVPKAQAPKLKRKEELEESLIEALESNSKADE
ncbi:transcription termination/antitermination protein NusA [Candidatus Saccharibacteria bacterium]|nr:transcription termination/antitermination protein NusA [Candidatus Saccharibacteria bacterium]MCB9821602.1 transcription termination/antitermination protein NusA [Candidatus Nomurabacteria bacterium]